MNEIANVIGLDELIASAGFQGDCTNFESFYDGLFGSVEYEDLRYKVEQSVHKYFAGLELPPTVTIYDQLLLGLREKDVIATFNWDPFLIQSLRRNRDYATLPNLLFLHGNTAVAACNSCRVKGCLDDICTRCGEALVPTRLLYPVKDKSYVGDPFIENEWKELENALLHASFVTLFGYSAPTTDEAAKNLMLGQWSSNPTNIFAGVEIIDIRLKEELQELWRPFMPNPRLAGIFGSLRETQLFRHPRRSCEAWFMAVMQGTPWPTCPMPEVESLSDLKSRLRPLLDEEVAGIFEGITLQDF